LFPFVIEVEREWECEMERLLLSFSSMAFSGGELGDTMDAMDFPSDALLRVGTCAAVGDADWCRIVS
jgi:hypothetical protein